MRNCPLTLWGHDYWTGENGLEADVLLWAPLLGLRGILHWGLDVHKYGSVILCPPPQPLGESPAKPSLGIFLVK